MIPISTLIKKLNEIQEYYPEVPVNIDKIVLHVSINENEIPIYVTFEKESNVNWKYFLFFV